MSNENVIWNTLMNEIKNPYGVAGVMGNLYAESKFDPECTYPKVPNYIERLKNGDISKEEFVNDGVAFGIVQWRYHSRKESLWETAKMYNMQVTDLKLQLIFLLIEIKTYKTVWETIYTTNSCIEASDVVMLRYEKPGSTTEAAKIKRSNYAQQFFNNNSVATKFITTERYYVTTAPRVNVRTGNGKNFGVLLQVGIEGTKLKYVAKADNNWVAVVTPSGNNVGWVDGIYLKEV